MTEEKKMQRIARRTAREMAQEIIRSGGTPVEMMQAAEMLTSQAHGNIDLGYVKTLLFPELYNADVPQPMSTQSYCRFTDKKEFNISSAGSGMLIFYPKINVGPSLFWRGGTLTTPLVFTNQSSVLGTGWKNGGWQDYSDYFSQTSMVAASISIQYTGQIQLEQGFMVGSQIYGISPSQLVLQDIENGQFRCLTKPGDGIRLVYVPKEISDFGYYGCGYPQASYGKPTSGPVRPRNGGKNPDGDILSVQFPTDAGAYMEGASPDLVSAGRYNNGQTGQVSTCTFNYQADADFIAIYWQGLYVPSVQSNPPATDLRIDVIRKFNGFPHAQMRDVLDIQKPKKIFDPKKTIDVISELQAAVPQVAGHSIKQMDRVSDQIQDFLPNIGHLYNEGSLRDGTTLEGFATQLQQAAGMAGGGSGNIVIE